MKEAIRIPIGGGNYLVAVRNPHQCNEREIGISIERDGENVQNIACVRSADRFKADGQLDWDDGTVEILAWADKDSENFTLSLKIEVNRENDFNC